MEEEIITPEEETFDYNKLRYILDKDGYVCHASLGGLIVCDLGECTEYNGEVPEEYETLVEWYDTQITENKLNAWKIIDGNLVFDENKFKELQSLCKIQEEENAPATHKWVNDKIKVSNSVVTDELASEANGTSLIVLNDAGNYEIPELKIESTTTNNVKVVSSNKNILRIDALTNTINGVDITVNGDGTITLNGTSTDAIEFDLNGSNTNQEMLYLIKNNISYAISGLTDNVSLSLYSYDGADRVYVGNYINQNITLSNSYKITETILSIPSGATFKEAVISPQIEIGGATSFIKHEETSSIGILEDNECFIDGLMSYADKTIIMIDEEVSSSVKYYTQQYLTKKFAEIEVNENEVKSTVAEMNETIEGQNTAISQISQTVNEIKSEINDIADITISADGYGSVSLDSINESEPIYIKIYPSNNEDISYIYPRDDLFPSDDLFLKGRTLRFQSDDYYIDYELPNDLLYYDENNYDEFILDYDAQTCEVNKKVGYNADGSKYLLETPKTISYKYPSIPLITGDYTVTMLSYDNAYMFIRMMCENIYTNQFATKVELNSAIIQTKDSITSQVKAEYATKNELVETETKINQTTNAINIEVNKKVNNSDYTSANIIAKVNNDTSSVQIKASKIDLTGYLTISSATNTYETKTNASSTYANKDSLSKGTTTINGGCLTTGTIDASKVTVKNLNASNITSGTISTSRLESKVITTDNFSAQKINADNITAGTLTGRAISGGSITGSAISGGSININKNGYYFNMGIYTNHPNCSGLNVDWGGINVNGLGFNSDGSTFTFAGGISTPYITATSNLTVNGILYNYGGIKTNTINPGGVLNILSGGSSGSASSYGILIRAGAGHISLDASNAGSNVSYGVYARGLGLGNGSITTSQGQASSRNTKENIVKFEEEDYDNALKLLKEIDLYSYDYKYNLYANKHQYGFIIDEVEKKENYSKFFDFYESKAKVNDDDDIDFAVDEEDEDLISIKQYQPDTLDKYLMTCLKALQNKIDSLEERLNVN